MCVCVCVCACVCVCTVCLMNWVHPVHPVTLVKGVTLPWQQKVLTLSSANASLRSRKYVGT